MKKIILSAGLLIFGSAFAQDTTYNKLSFDFGLGVNDPFTPGNAQGYDGRVLNPSLNLGLRKMFNKNVGLGAQMSYNNFSSSSASKKDYSSTLISVSFNGFVNLTNLMNFSEFSSKIGLLGHLGGGGSFMVNNNIDGVDLIYNLSFGLTPQYYLSPKFALNVDAGLVTNMRQSNTYDFAAGNYNLGLTGAYYAYATIGGSYYSFGKNKDKVHADWSPNGDDTKKKLADLKDKLAAAEARLVDTDKDGVVDFLDVEPSTPEGSFVNTKGQRIVDMDGDGIVDSEDFCPTVKGTAEFKGCPTAFASEVKSNNDGLEGEEVQGELKFKVAKVTKDVTFDTKSTSVKSNFKVELDALAKALNENTKLVVALHGHCDNVGEDALNNSLSTERAQSVKDYLVSKGVNASRITTKGHGTSLPKVSNDTEKGRATNRRVEFVVKSK